MNKRIVKNTLVAITIICCVYFALLLHKSREIMRHTILIEEFGGNVSFFISSVNQEKKPLLVFFRERLGIALFDYPYAVRLNGIRVKDEQLHAISQLKNVIQVDIHDSLITDRQLHLLAQVRKLRWLHLHAESISDDDLRALAGLSSSLKYLDLSGTSISADGVERLRKLRPSVQIEDGRLEDGRR